MTTRLLGGALAALALLPATAQAAALTPLKPCYISVTQRSPATRRRSRRSGSTSAGNGFTPGSLVDLELRRHARPHGPGRRRPATCRRRSCKSPYRARGRGPVHADRGRAGQPAQRRLAGVAHDRARRCGCARARPSPATACASRGRGFTEQRAVWAHYLLKGKVRKTVRLVRRIDNPCGTLLGPPQADPDQAARRPGPGRCRSTSSGATAARPTACSCASTIDVFSRGKR